MDRTRYRLTYAGLTLALIAVVATVIALFPHGEPAQIPETIESIFPLPGDIVVRQTAIQVDLPVGYTLDLVVDGVPIPDGEIGFTEPTGEYLWQPQPGSTIEQWQGGEHTVRISWERTYDRPDPGTFEWSFIVR